MSRLSLCGLDIAGNGYIGITKSGVTRKWILPSFPLGNGYTRVEKVIAVNENPFKDGVEAEIEYSFSNSPATLIVRIQSRPQTNFIRIKYSLKGEDSFCGLDGDKRILYGGLAMDSYGLSELQLSQFDRILHSFIPSIEYYKASECNGVPFIGPIVVPEDELGVVLAAYEHGAEAPDHFLEWTRDDDGIMLRSVKGNYFGGQKAEDYAAPWIELGIAKSEDILFREYRQFMLEDMAVYGDSRKPYIFFNSWHNQEGKKYFEDASFLEYMNQEFTLKDIDIAHQMGIEVYVIDTGWFQKTGDWEVNEKTFPEMMKPVRDRLEKYGMRLGLWFNPIAVAQTSEMYVKHPECVMNWNGKDRYWGKIWETEESYGMCLVSDYSDMFIEKLVSLNKTLGVSYFKWDAVGQYGCDSPNHNHGTEANSSQERADAYAYRMGLELIRIAQEVSRRCPGAIVDFDITEGQRFVGLGFLSAGKYFLMNNGPYFQNFDIPNTVKIEPDTINVFFYPGAAHPQICRQASRFDSYIPSVLFLTHYYSYGSVLGQRNAMAALTLGGNGIWGFLQEMNQEDIERWAEFLTKYKKVREDAALAYPLQRGNQGGSPEIHEKLNSNTGRGAVVFFTHGKGIYTHITQPMKEPPTSVDGADSYEILEDNRVKIKVSLAEDEAKVIFFF